jgi:putative hemolysin
MDMSSVITGVLLIAACIVVNGLLVAAEYALVSIRKSRVDEMVQAKEPGARTVFALKSKIERSIAGSQMGITLASLSIGWLGGEIMPEVAKTVIGYIPALAALPPGVLAFTLAFFVLSMTQMIFGEQVPKQIALRLPEKTIVRLAKPFQLFCFVMTPFIWMTSMTAALTLRLFRIHEIEAQQRHLPSQDEFQILFEESEKAGTLGKQESDLLRRALELKALAVREVMVPRTLMDMISESLTLPEVLAVIAKTKHSKLPVYRGRDGVVGILNTRDLFDVWSNHLKTPDPAAQPFKLSAFIRSAYFVPDSMEASTLLEEMRARQLQMAIVIDEFGATVGLITLEDLIEQLVGEIWDEYDKPNSSIQAVGPGIWHVQGELTLFEFNKAFDASVQCQHCTSIAGAVIEKLGRQPNVGEQLAFSGFEFEVLEIKRHTISRLQVKRSTPTPTDSVEPANPHGPHDQ